MNRIARIAAIALTIAATGSAFADDITIDNTPAVSTKSRAEVRADLAQFQAGKTDPWNLEYSVAANFKSQLTREQVVAQLKAARVSGELDALASEDSGSTYLAQHRSSTAPVRLATLTR